MHQPQTWALVVLILFLSAGQVRSQNDASPPAEKGDPPKLPKVLGPGETAPEWVVTGWSDGKARKLSDYRGKVVVIDFWGVWCGPCRRMIPAIKELHKKYQKQDVVFIAIHSAGTKMDKVKEALRVETWSDPTGIDKGEDIQEGETVQRYGVRGFPTLVVINKKGLVTYNSSENLGVKEPEEAMKEMKQLALAAGLPWPIDKDAEDFDEITRRFNRLAVYMYGLEIDRALNEDNPPEKVEKP